MNPHHTRTGLYAGLLLFAVLAPAIFWQGGTLDYEAISFITHYT